MQLQFLTRIPIPVKIDFNERQFVSGLIYAPLVGLIMGIILSGFFFITEMLGFRIISVVTVITVEIILSGGLHLDGLADSADGLFSNQPKKRILEIMRDSQIGTNGTLALIMVILLKIVLLLSISDVFIFHVIILMPVLSRMTISWTGFLSPYARDGVNGMGKSIAEYTGIKEIIISTLFALIIAIAVFYNYYLFIPLFLIIISILFTVIFISYSKKKIGGTTGDIIGAVIELNEVVFLLFILLFSVIIKNNNLNFLY